MGTQVNRASESVLVCCTCPDGETKYSHLCACPSPLVSYSSLSKNAEMVGYRQYFPNSIYGTVDAFLVSSRTFLTWRPTSLTTPTYSLTVDEITYTKYHVITEAERTIAADSGSLQNATGDWPTIRHCTETGQPDSESASKLTIGGGDAGIISITVNTPPVLSGCGPAGDYTPEYSVLDNRPKFELANEFTEADAVFYATGTEGTDPTSIWEIRTYVLLSGGGVSPVWNFTYRTSAYTVKSSTVVAGIEYQGCVRLQRRAAYRSVAPEGVDTVNWEDVAPDIIEPFFAAPDAEGVTTIAEATDLPFVRGYEYRVEGVYIWPTYADCECPSEFEEVV